MFKLPSHPNPQLLNLPFCTHTLSCILCSGVKCRNSVATRTPGRHVGRASKKHALQSGLCWNTVRDRWEFVIVKLLHSVLVLRRCLRIISVRTAQYLISSPLWLVLKVGLYFWRSQAPHTPPRSALVRGISWRVPIGVSMRKSLRKKYKPTRVHKRWQKLNDFQDTGLNNVY